jgi:hypothetical protein
VYGDDSAGEGISFRDSFLEKNFQRFPGAPAQFREQSSIIKKISPQDLRGAEDKMTKVKEKI